LALAGLFGVCSSSSLNTHRLTESDFRFDIQDGGHNVILRNKVLPSGGEHEASAGAYAAVSVSS